MFILRALGHGPAMALVQKDAGKLLWMLPYEPNLAVPATLAPEQEQYIRTTTKKTPLYFEKLPLPAPVIHATLPARRDICVLSLMNLR